MQTFVNVVVCLGLIWLILWFVLLRNGGGGPGGPRF